MVLALLECILTNKIIPLKLLRFRSQCFNQLWSDCYPGATEPVAVINKGDGTHTVNYTPAEQGPYTVSVKYAEKDVPHRSDHTHTPTYPHTQTQKFEYLSIQMSVLYFSLYYYRVGVAIEVIISIAKGVLF